MPLSARSSINPTTSVKSGFPRITKALRLAATREKKRAVSTRPFGREANIIPRNAWICNGSVVGHTDGEGRF